MLYIYICILYGIWKDTEPRKRPQSERYFRSMTCTSSNWQKKKEEKKTCTSSIPSHRGEEEPYSSACRMEPRHVWAPPLPLTATQSVSQLSLSFLGLSPPLTVVCPSPGAIFRCIRPHVHSLQSS